MTTGNADGEDGTMNDEPNAIQEVVADLLAMREVLGVIAVSSEGLVLASAGVDGEDAEMLGALGASLVGVAERTIRRLGATSPAETLSIGAGEGMVHIRSGGDLALIVLTEPCDASRIHTASGEALSRISSTLALV